MEITEYINFIKDVPIWSWVIFFIVFMMIFGDRDIWEYEAHFTFQENIGHGEFEIECKGNKRFNRRRTHVEAKLTLEPAAQGREYEIYLNGIQVLSIPSHKTTKPHVFVREKYLGDEPRQGDNVEIKSGMDTIFTARLHRD